MRSHREDVELEALRAVADAGTTGLVMDTTFPVLISGHLPATWLYLVAQGWIFGLNNRLRLTAHGRAVLKKHEAPPRKRVLHVHTDIRNGARG